MAVMNHVEAGMQAAGFRENLAFGLVCKVANTVETSMQAEPPFEVPCVRTCMRGGQDCRGGHAGGRA